MARRKVKNGEKSPWGQCLTTPVLNGRRRSGFWLVPENFCVFLLNQKPERRWPFGTGLVRHCPQAHFSPFFTFLRAIFFRPFRLSLAPTIGPWVSEDDSPLMNNSEIINTVYFPRKTYLGFSIFRQAYSSKIQYVDPNWQSWHWTLLQILIMYVGSVNVSSTIPSTQSH